MAVLREVLTKTNASTADVEAVMIGTTHFTNAVVERKRLLQVAAVRIGLPATKGLPPVVDWPAALASTLGRHTFMVRGGHEFDGREIAPLDEGELRRIAGEIRKHGIKSAAVAPFDPARDPVKITIQNEYLLAKERDRVLVIVPDLVCLLDLDTAEPITTERLRYGHRVNVLAIQTPPIMRTPEALKVFGPRCFALDYEYTPIAS